MGKIFILYDVYGFGFILEIFHPTFYNLYKLSCETESALNDQVLCM